MTTFHSDLAQNTPEWQEFRRQHITASDVPAIMGLSPYRSPLMIYKEKTELRVIEQMTLAQSLGHKFEPIARSLAETKLGELYPATIVSKGYLSASLDGYNKDLNRIMEIKYQGKENHHKLIDEKFVPEHYMLQMQAQMLISGAESCWFVSFNPDDDQPLQMLLVGELKQMQSRISIAAREFKSLLDNKTPPEMTDLDAVALDEVLPDIAALMAEAAELDHDRKAIESRIDVLKAEIEEQLDQQNVRFGRSRYGSVKRITRAGSVDYKKIPELEKVDLSKYKKPDTEFWQFRLKL